MPVRARTRLGEPCWAELVTSDPARAGEFYTRLFGWSETESGPEDGTSVTFRKGEARIAGMGTQLRGSTTPDAWTTYLAVADVDATTAAARAAGAQVLAEPENLGTMCRMAILMDPAGATIGLWQSLEHTGFGAVDEAGTPVWHELNTRDWDAARRFYEKVFDWKLKPLSDTEEFRYSTFGGADDMAGGIFDAKASLPPETPSHWQLYLGVPDVAAAAARVTELGGTVLWEPWDTEYGTFAQVTDPTGAMFMLSSVEQPT